MPSRQGLPQVYRKDSAAVLTYNYADTLRGNAYLRFYGGRVNLAKSKQIYYDTNDDTDNEAANTNIWWAQTFKVGSEDIYVRSIEIKTRSEGLGGTSIVYITKLDGSNLPDMTNIISYGSYNNGGGTDFYEATVDTCRLLANTSYALVINPYWSSTSTNMHVYSDDSSPTYTDGNWCTSTDSGSSWSADTSKDMMFRINGATTNPYILFSQAFTSDTEQETGKQIVNLESEVKVAARIGGYALINVNTSGQTDIKAEIFLVRGTTDTSLGSSTCEVDTTRKAIGIDITETQLLPDDKIKLTISSVTGNFTIDYSTTDAELILDLPFIARL